MSPQHTASGARSATPNRSGLISRPSQADRIAEVFSARPHVWIPLTDLLSLRPRIADIAARIWELRHRRAMALENKIERRNGEIHSYFRYTPDQTPKGARSDTSPSLESLNPTEGLFGDLREHHSAFDVQGGR